MKAESLIFISYFAFSALSVMCVCVTTATEEDVLLGLIYMWVCFIFFYASSNSNKSVGNRLEKSKFCLRRYWLLALLAIFCAIFSAYYYTGNTPIDVIEHLRLGDSLYQIYQNYLKSNQIGILSWQKIPAILANITVEFVFIYSFICVLVVRKKVQRKDLLLIISATAAKVYFGISRGTNFEMFEIAFLSIYCFWVRGASNKFRMKKIIMMALGVIICVLVFMKVIEIRGHYVNFVWISEEIYTDMGNTIVINHPVLARIVATLAGYFSFGIFVLSYYFQNCFFENIYSFIGGIVPLGNRLFDVALPSLDTTAHLKGVSWTPDLFLVIRDLGVFAGPVVYGILGSCYKKLSKKTIVGRTVLLEMLKFFIIYQLFSMPVGNLLWISSSLRIIVLVSVLLALVKVA